MDQLPSTPWPGFLKCWGWLIGLPWRWRAQQQHCGMAVDGAPCATGTGWARQKPHQLSLAS